VSLRKADADIGFRMNATTAVQASKHVCICETPQALRCAGLTVDYEPERFRGGMQIKVPVAGGKELNVIVFHTGKSSVAGNASEQDLQSSYARVLHNWPYR